MSSSLNVTVALSHPYMPANVDHDEPFYALLNIIPTPDAGTDDRPPLNIVIVVDSSATMHHFHLSEVEREYWMSLAISRDELERGQADARDAVYWTGQTLDELMSSVRKPMNLAVDAIKNMLGTLKPADRVSVIAFADRVHTVFSEHDWSNYPAQCLSQMDALRDQRLPIDLGTGTYMAEALRMAGSSLRNNSLPNTINRLIVISDGIVQDPDATLGNIEQIQQEGFAITTIGVGDEFDEEFLTRVADNSRGEYHYASTFEEITSALQTEIAHLQAAMVTDLYIAVRGLSGSFIQDISLVLPSMALFDEVYTDDDWVRARVGDVSSKSPAGILLQYIPAKLEPGFHLVAEAQLTWANPGTTAMNKGNQKVTVAADFSEDSAEWSQINTRITDLVDRFTVYKLEREAQRAHERGDLNTAREKYGAATRQLHQIGEDELAAEMEAQVESLGDPSADPTRGKRIKSTTRRLANILASQGATRQLNTPKSDEDSTGEP